MSIIASNTPQYVGEGQPTATDSDNGILARLTSLVAGILGGGGATPSYVGDGQPAARQRGLLLFVDQTPTYVGPDVLGPDPDAEEPEPDDDQPTPDAGLGVGGAL